jgi:hypothetical protein
MLDSTPYRTVPYRTVPYYRSNVFRGAVSFEGFRLTGLRTDRPTEGLESVSEQNFDRSMSVADEQDEEDNAPWIPAEKDKSSTFRTATVQDAAATGFIYGNGSLGQGFYGQETRDAYDILLVKIKAKAAYRQAELQNHGRNSATTCFSQCMPLKPDPRKDPYRNVKVQQLQYATHLVALVQARREARGPYVRLTTDEIANHGGNPAKSMAYSFQDLVELSVTKKVKRRPAYVMRCMHKPCAHPRRD